MGKTYKDSKGANPLTKPKNKKSQKNKRVKNKEEIYEQRRDTEGSS